MGRAPCCDKSKVKRGPWSPEEDATLKTYLQNHGTGGNWICLPQKAGLKRCGKSCRLRWLNYLRPDIKHGPFTDEEDFIIYTLYNRIGSRWSVIASKLEGRTDNDVKNHWNTKLKKKYLIMTESISMSSSGMVPPGGGTTTFNIDIGINNSYPSITTYDLNNFTTTTSTPSTNYYHPDNYNDHLKFNVTNNMVTPKLEYVEPYYPHYFSAASGGGSSEGGGSSDFSGDNVIGAMVSESYDIGMMSNNNVMDGYYFSGFGFGDSTGSSTSNNHSEYHGNDQDHVVGTRMWCGSVDDDRRFEGVNLDGYGTNYYGEYNIESGGDRSMWECYGTN